MQRKTLVIYDLRFTNNAQRSCGRRVNSADALSIRTYSRRACCTSYIATAFSNAVALGAFLNILLYPSFRLKINAAMGNFRSVLILSALLASCEFIPNNAAEVSGASAPSPSYKETTIPPQTVIPYDRDGVKTGSYKKSGTAINQYDQYGKKIGSLKETSNGYSSYDKYGAKTGSFKTNGATTTQYDKYGSKIGTYKTSSTGVTTSYDKYGRKTGSFKEDSSGRITEYDKNGKKIGSYKQKR